MEISLLRPRARRKLGFALVETMIALVILAVGLLGLAALLAKLSGTSTTSRYMGTEVMLVSEKLEDLNRAAKGTLVAGGSLTANVANFFDSVQMSSDAGTIQDGLNGAPGAPDATTLMFDRRWVIEQNQPVNGTLRITVIVIPLTGTTVDRAQTFQSSLVRPL